MAIVFNATFNNISVVSRRSVLLVEETRVPGENHISASDKLYHIVLYRVHMAMHEIRTLNFSSHTHWSHRWL